MRMSACEAARLGGGAEGALANGLPLLPNLRPPLRSSFPLLNSRALCEVPGMSCFSIRLQLSSPALVAKPLHLLVSPLVALKP